jgi:hypothetical protein
MNPTLHALASDAFAVEIGFLLPSRALRIRLRRAAAVQRVELAVRLGAIGEADVRAFAAEMVRSFRPGSLLPGELALAALAVALESCPQDFAEEYICHLAKLKLSEMATAIRVAKGCLTARFARPKNQVRQFPFPEQPDRQQVAFRVLSPRPNDGRSKAGGSRYVTARA